MKKLFLVLAATFICGACLFTSCKKDEEKTDLNLSEKIIGKWVIADINGQPELTNGKMVYTFVSTTQAYVSASLNTHLEVGMLWFNQKETTVAIDGNKMTLTIHPDEHTTCVEEITVTAISGSEFTANRKITVTVDGNEKISPEQNVRFVKTTADYSEAIYGFWRCQGITGGETYNDGNAQLQFLRDGTYKFYRKDDGGQWNLVPRERNEYFVDGNLLCTRWQAAGEEMNYEWWEITSINGNNMQWTALRQNDDGSTFQQGVRWQRAIE